MGEKDKICKKIYKGLEVLAEAGFKFGLHTNSNIGFRIDGEENEEDIWIYPEKGNMNLNFDSDWKKPNSYDIKSMYGDIRFMYEPKSNDSWTNLVLSNGDSLKNYHLYSGETKPKGEVLNSSEIFGFMNYIQSK